VVATLQLPLPQVSVEPYWVKEALYDVAAEARPAEAARRVIEVYMVGLVS
jgi:hypothetical protein